MLVRNTADVAFSVQLKYRLKSGCALMSDGLPVSAMMPEKYVLSSCQWLVTYSNASTLMVTASSSSTVPATTLVVSMLAVLSMSSSPVRSMTGSARIVS